MRILARRLSAIGLSLFLFAGSLHAADAPDLIPSSVSAVIRMKSPDKTVEGIAEFVNEVQPGFGALIQGQAGMLGVGISNPTMNGVDKNQDFWAAIFLEEEEEPSVVFIIPDSDAEAMEKAIDDSFEFFAYEGFGIYSEDKEAVNIIRKHLNNPRAESIADVASDSMKEVVSGADVALAVNLVAVKEIYEDELELARKKFEDVLEEIPTQTLEIPGMKLDWIPDVAEEFGEHLFSAVEDAQGYAVTFKATKNGLEFQEFLEFAGGTPSSSFLAKHPPEALSVIKKLPADQLMYGALGNCVASMNEWGMHFIPKVFDLTEEQEKQWAEILQKMKKVNFGSTAMSFSLGDPESGLIRAFTAAEAAPSDLVRETAKSAAEVMGTLEFPGMKQEMTYEENVEKIDGVDIDILTTKQELDDAQAGGFQTQITQIFYGGDAVETRIAYLDGVTLQTVGGGKDSMKTALEAFKKNAAGSDEVVTRDLAPHGRTSNGVFIFDVPTMIVNGLKIAVNSPLLPPLPFDEDSLEDLNVQRSYLGCSFHLNETSCRAKIYIPKQTVQAGITLFGFFQELQNNANAL